MALLLEQYASNQIQALTLIFSIPATDSLLR